MVEVYQSPFSPLSFRFHLNNDCHWLYLLYRPFEKMNQRVLVQGRGPGLETWGQRMLWQWGSGCEPSRAQQTACGKNEELKGRRACHAGNIREYSVQGVWSTRKPVTVTQHASWWQDRARLSRAKRLEN